MGERGLMPLLQVRVSQEILDDLAALLPAIQRYHNSGSWQSSGNQVAPRLARAQEPSVHRQPP